jgi:predicted regulator of Ras-like GTPase activity (Roadblock/LC7/MglB family)
MDAAQALADLTEISSQIQAAVVLDGDGSTIGSTLRDEARSAELARSAKELLAAVERASGERAKELAQLEVATIEGSVFLVRDGERTIAATTVPEPTVGLVFYDLKSCLRSLGAEEKPKPKRAPRKKAEERAAP